MVKNETVREEFIKENIGLVRSLIKRFVGKGIEYEDLFQSGCMGLVKAFDAFDDTRGLCFSTYAVPVILGEIRRLFRDGGAVKVSRSVRELGMKTAREKTLFEQKYGREPSVSELAEIMGVSPEEVTEAVCASQSTVSLTANDENEYREIDLPVVDDEDIITGRLTLTEAFEKLEKKEKDIINYRYFEYLTQKKTAEKLDMTQVQVSRSERKILLKLRELLN